MCFTRSKTSEGICALQEVKQARECTFYKQQNKRGNVCSTGVLALQEATKFENIHFTGNKTRYLYCSTQCIIHKLGYVTLLNE